MTAILIQVLAIMGLVVVITAVSSLIAVREAERRAREQAAEAVFQAMAAGAHLREQAWRTRRAMRNVPSDVIDVEPDDAA